MKKMIACGLVVLVGCGSSTGGTANAGTACDGGRQCSGGLVCAYVSENPAAGNCEPTCNPDGGTSGCPTGRFCQVNGLFFETGTPEYTCFAQRNGIDDECSANNECLSSTCYDAGVYGGFCKPTDGGFPNASECMQNSDCSSLNCADGGYLDLEHDQPCTAAADAGGLCVYVSFCAPDGGLGDPNGDACESNSWCQSLNCTGAGSSIFGQCAADAGN